MNVNVRVNKAGKDQLSCRIDDLSLSRHCEVKPDAGYGFMLDKDIGA
jgi:hypothetical protein